MTDEELRRLEPRLRKAMEKWGDGQVVLMLQIDELFLLFSAVKLALTHPMYDREAGVALRRIMRVSMEGLKLVDEDLGFYLEALMAGCEQPKGG